jgi:hypothetical protein
MENLGVMAMVNAAWRHPPPEMGEGGGGASVVGEKGGLTMVRLLLDGDGALSKWC